jgi:uncharacterized membrane protein
MITCCIICNLIGYTLACETLPSQRRGLILGTLEIVICLGQLQNIVIMMFTHNNLEDGNISAFLLIIIIIMIFTSLLIYLCIEESPRFLFFEDMHREQLEIKEFGQKKIGFKHKNNENNGSFSHEEKNLNEELLKISNDYENNKSEDGVLENQKNLNRRIKPYHHLLLKIIAKNNSSYKLQTSTITELEEWGRKSHLEKLEGEKCGNGMGPLFNER